MTGRLPVTDADRLPNTSKRIKDNVGTQWDDDAPLEKVFTTNASDAETWKGLHALNNDDVEQKVRHNGEDWYPHHIEQVTHADGQTECMVLLRRFSEKRVGGTFKKAR